MANIERLTALGEKYGLSGKSLMNWVSEQQKQERADREAARLIEKENQEYEQRKLEGEQRKAELTLELERMAVRKAELQKDTQYVVVQDRNGGRGSTRDHEQNEREGETDNDSQTGEENDGNNDHLGIFVSKKGPRIPAFDDEKDDLDSYLFRFERYAVLQGWKRKDWAIYLSALLKGKALEVYSPLPVEEAHDYDKLKLALLKRFQLTEEGFKERFRTAKAERGESPAQFLARLYSYLSRWVDLAQVNHDFDSLMMMLVHEQYIATCSKDMTLFLKERKPKTIDDLAQMAEQYLEAHPVRFVDKSDVRSSAAEVQQPQSQRMPKFSQSSPAKGALSAIKLVTLRVIVFADRELLVFKVVTNFVLIDSQIISSHSVQLVKIVKPNQRYMLMNMQKVYGVVHITVYDVQIAWFCQQLVITIVMLCCLIT